MQQEFLKLLNDYQKNPARTLVEWQKQINHILNNLTNGDYVTTSAVNVLLTDFANYYPTNNAEAAFALLGSIVLTNALTASRLVSTNADGELVNVANLQSWIEGVVNQTSVTDDGDGTITISLPQNIDTSADVEFDSIKLDDLTQSRMISTDSNKKLVSIANLASWIAGTAYQISIADDGDGTITISFPSVVRLGDLAGGNYSEFEADGTLKFVGNATTFDDLQFGISGGKVPAVNTPTFEAFTTNTNEYSFAVDDYIDLSANELFHRWKIGSSGEFHLHVTTKAANGTGANRFAKFTLYIAYADTNEVWVETSLTEELTIPDGTAALTHFLLNMGDLALTNQLIGCQVKLRVKRIAATGGTEYAGNIFITQVGSHLEQDTIGSRTEYVK